MTRTLVVWFSLGALGLGIVMLEGARRKITIAGRWYYLAVLLGPIFLCFILPLWLGRWGRGRR